MIPKSETAEQLIIFSLSTSIHPTSYNPLHVHAVVETERNLRGCARRGGERSSVDFSQQSNNQGPSSRPSGAVGRTRSRARRPTLVIPVDGKPFTRTRRRHRQNQNSLLRIN